MASTQFLTKPVKHSDLLEALSRLFGVSPRSTDAPSPLTERIGSRPGVPLHVLVAEDNLVNRKLVTTLLRKRGHKVKAVDNGRKAVEAIQAAKDRPFDVVLMDLQMPEMSGFEASQAIRRVGERDRRQAAAAHRVDRSRDAGDRERCLRPAWTGICRSPST